MLPRSLGFGLLSSVVQGAPKNNMFFRNSLVFRTAASLSRKPHTAGGQIQFPGSQGTSKSSMSHISNVVFSDNCRKLTYFLPLESNHCIKPSSSRFGLWPTAHYLPSSIFFHHMQTFVCFFLSGLFEFDSYVHFFFISFSFLFFSFCCGDENPEK